MAAGDETRKLGQKAGSKARPKAKARRGPTTLGQSIEQVTNRTMARRGFNEASIATRWPEIVGRPLCDHCRPFRIVFPRGERRGGTLHLTVTGAFAPEVTHLSPQIIERINGYFGYGAVDRLELHHGTVAPSAAAPPKKSGKGTDTPPPPDGALAATLAKVEDPDLRAALGRLVTAHTTSRQNDD